MTDQLKVFKNQVGATKTASLSTTTIDVLTTASNEQAVVKDIQLSVSHSDPLYAGVYKYPVALKLGGFTLASVASAASLTLTGQQIVDSSSSLSIDILPEAQGYFYGTFKALMPLSGSTALYSYTLALLGEVPAKSNVLKILSDSKTNAVTVLAGVIPAAKSGCTITVGGATKWCYTDGTTLTIINENGTTYATYSWPNTTNAIVADGTYIYGKSTTSNQIIYRYNYTTLAAASNLTTDTTIPGYGSSNKGFVDSYNGFMYIKINGSDGSIYKINLTTGVTAVLSCSMVETEMLGGVINMNQSGVPYIVMAGDAQFEVYNLNTNVTTVYSGNWPTPPTTTSGNNVLSIANGLVLVNNGSYNTTAVIDINGSVPTMTQTTTALSLGNEGKIFIGQKFQTPVTAVAREITYNLYAGGVQATN